MLSRSPRILARAAVCPVATFPLSDAEHVLRCGRCGLRVAGCGLCESAFLQSSVILSGMPRRRRTPPGGAGARSTPFALRWNALVPVTELLPEVSRPQERSSRAHSARRGPSTSWHSAQDDRAFEGTRFPTTHNPQRPRRDICSLLLRWCAPAKCFPGRRAGAVPAPRSRAAAFPPRRCPPLAAGARTR